MQDITTPPSYNIQLSDALLTTETGCERNWRVMLSDGPPHPYYDFLFIFPITNCESPCKKLVFHDSQLLAAISQYHSVSVSVIAIPIFVWAHVSLLYL